MTVLGTVEPKKFTIVSLALAELIANHSSSRIGVLVLRPVTSHGLILPCNMPRQDSDDGFDDGLGPYAGAPPRTRKPPGPPRHNLYGASVVRYDMACTSAHDIDFLPERICPPDLSVRVSGSFLHGLWPRHMHIHPCVCAQLLLLSCGCCHLVHSAFSARWRGLWFTWTRTLPTLHRTCNRRNARMGERSRNRHRSRRGTDRNSHRRRVGMDAHHATNGPLVQASRAGPDVRRRCHRPGGALHTAELGGLRLVPSMQPVTNGVRSFSRLCGANSLRNHSILPPGIPPDSLQAASRPTGAGSQFRYNHRGLQAAGARNGLRRVNGYTGCSNRWTPSGRNRTKRTGSVDCTTVACGKSWRR